MLESAGHGCPQCRDNTARQESQQNEFQKRGVRNRRSVPIDHTESNICSMQIGSSNSVKEERRLPQDKTTMQKIKYIQHQPAEMTLRQRSRSERDPNFASTAKDFTSRRLNHIRRVRSAPKSRTSVRSRTCRVDSSSQNQ